MEVSITLFNVSEFKIIHVPCSKKSHYKYSNNCTKIRLNNIQTCDNPATYFVLFRPPSGRFYCIFLCWIGPWGRPKRPKRLGGLPHFRILLYRIIVSLCNIYGFNSFLHAILVDYYLSEVINQFVNTAHRSKAWLDILAGKLYTTQISWHNLFREMLGVIQIR
jgi:hypothetical protein